MGNKQLKDEQFINDIKKFFNKQFNNKLPNQLQNLFQSFQKHRMSCSYGTYLNPIQNYYASINNKGIVYQVNKSFYYGNIVNKQGQGDGIIFYKNFMYYKGTFSKGKPQGNGVLYYSIGNFISQNGQWKQGKLISGFIKPEQGSQISSITKKNQKQYKITYKDNSYYQGQGDIQDNDFIKQGKGILQNPYIKYKYDGQWKDNKKQGRCNQYIYGNIKYSGTFSNNLKLKGIYQDNVYIYDGSWENGTIFTGSIKHIATGKLQEYKNNLKVSS